MLQALQEIVSKFFSALGKEESVLQELHGQVQATLERLEAEDPGLKQLLDDAYAYAVFPSIGKATLVIGGAFGKGEVFQKGHLIGYAGTVQLTLGVQLGGQTFSQIIAFESKQALDRFKAGKLAFAANASAVLVKAGAASTADYESGAAVFVYSEGGLMLEAAIGGQKFFFKPALLGRTRSATSKGQPLRKKAKASRSGHGRSPKSRPHTASRRTTRAKPKAQRSRRSPQTQSSRSVRHQTRNRS